MKKYSNPVVEVLSLVAFERINEIEGGFKEISNFPEEDLF